MELKIDVQDDYEHWVTLDLFGDADLIARILELLKAADMKIN